MNTLKTTMLSSAIGLSIALSSAQISNAGIFSHVIAIPDAKSASQARVLEIKHKKKRFKRRYHKKRFGKKGRHRHRHNNDDIWFVLPYLLEPHHYEPHYSAPRYSGRCEYWSAMCYSNWGGGSNYIGCMRYHHCY